MKEVGRREEWQQKRVWKPIEKTRKYGLSVVYGIVECIVKGNNRSYKISEVMPQGASNCHHHHESLFQMLFSHHFLSSKAETPQSIEQSFNSSGYGSLLQVIGFSQGVIPNHQR